MGETSGQMWVATVAWRGDAYAGWQIQPNERTIQGELGAALASLCGQDEPVHVRASGRTDSGVHAEMQVIGFRLPVERAPHQVVFGINRHTPDDISCLSASPAADNFSPRSWTKKKLYRYRIVNRPSGCPFREAVAWHVKRKLNLEDIQAAIPHLLGQHDYSSFRAAGCSAVETIRTVPEGRAYRADEGEIRIEFEGHGFLRHQVRIMVGTLVEVGHGAIAAERMATIRDLKKRAAAGPTAPAKGLTLVHVELLDGPRDDEPA